MEPRNNNSKIDLIIAIFGVVIAALAYYSSDRQNKLSRQYLNVEYRPYIRININPKKFHYTKFRDIGQYREMMDLNINREFINDGKTPALPVYHKISVLPYDIIKFNMRDSILLMDKEISQQIKVHSADNKLLFAIVINYRTGLLQSSDSRYGFNKMIFKDDPIAANEICRGFMDLNDTTFYIHQYLVYKDKFDLYHDLYKVDKIKLKGKHVGYDVTMYQTNEISETYKKNPVPKQLLELKSN